MARSPPWKGENLGEWSWRRHVASSWQSLAGPLEPDWDRPHALHQGLLYPPTWTWILSKVAV